MEWKVLPLVFLLSFDVKGCVQLISTVYWHKFICCFIKGGEIMNYNMDGLHGIPSFSETMNKTIQGER